jgi:hypothetical protein
VCKASDGDPGKGVPQDGSVALPDADQVRAFKAVRRPATEADSALPEAAAHGLPEHLDARWDDASIPARKAKPISSPGQPQCASSRPARASALLEARRRQRWLLRAAHGFICGAGSRRKPVTFVGILPADAQRLEVLDRAGRRIAAAPNDDDSHWLEVADPTRMFLVRHDGTEKEIPFASGVE